jgi:ABC-type microcin C transport system duplicated ATPase subunit YejF
MPGEVLGLWANPAAAKRHLHLRSAAVVALAKLWKVKFSLRQDLLKLSEAEMMENRGNRISMIFQQPQSSLNPLFRWGRRWRKSSRFTKS